MSRIKIDLYNLIYSCLNTTRIQYANTICYHFIYIYIYQKQWSTKVWAAHVIAPKSKPEMILRSLFFNSPITTNNFLIIPITTNTEVFSFSEIFQQLSVDSIWVKKTKKKKGFQRFYFDFCWL
jgi:hypothetical protein